MLFAWMWLRSTGFPFDWLDELTLPGLVDPAASEYDDPAAYAGIALASRRLLAYRLGDPAVVEALLLSNVDAVDRMAGLAAADPTRPNVRLRQRVRLAWAYLQRFCGKNETCSTFGPLAWGTVDPDAVGSLDLSPVDAELGWLRRRQVSLEFWVVRRLSEQLTRSAATALPYQLNPACDLEGTRLRMPLGREVTLPPAAARFVRAAAAGAAAAATPPPHRTIGALIDAGVLRRRIAVAPETREPLDAIEKAVGAPLPTLTRLAELRRTFEIRTGHAERRVLLDELRGSLEEAGVDASRARGTAYAGRLPVYEDCERNLRFRVGGPLAAVLRQQLPPLLRLYRVVAECVAGALNDHYLAVWDELAAQRGAPTDFPTFLHAAAATDTRERVRRTITARLRRLLAQAWSGFGWAADAAEVVIDDGHLAAVTARLRERHPGHARFADVLGVRVMSPDIMVVPADPGVPTVVVGEVHPCVLAAMQSVALPFLDESAAALSTADEWLGGDRIVLAATDAAYQRSQFTWPVTARLHEVVLPASTGRCPPQRCIPAGRGRVERRDGIVVFVDRAGGLADDMVTVLSSDLQHVMFALAGAVIGGEVTGRVRYGDVVARRRWWAPEPGGLPAVARPAEDLADYRAMRGWAEAHGLPRRSFFRVDTEPKPIYLDWANPVAVDTFAKLARGAGRLRLSELLPGPDELWLAGPFGGRHTAELRMSYLV